MRKPLIGLTPAHDTDNNDIKMRPTYLRALKAAGGIPVVMPLEADEEELKQLTDELDGFLFTGGPDVHPFLFGEETQAHCGNVSEARDRMEIGLLPFVLEKQKTDSWDLQRDSGVEYRYGRDDLAGYLFYDKIGFSYRTYAAICISYAQPYGFFGKGNHAKGNCWYGYITG